MIDPVKSDIEKQSDSAGVGSVLVQAFKALTAFMMTPPGQAIVAGEDKGDNDDQKGMSSGVKKRGFRPGLRTGLNLVHDAMAHKSTLFEMTAKYSITMKNGRSYFLKPGDRFNLAKVHVLGMRVITLHNPFKTFRISKQQANNLIARSKKVGRKETETAGAIFDWNPGDSVYIESTRQFEHSHITGSVVATGKGFVSIDIANEIVILPEYKITLHGKQNGVWRID